MIKKLFLGLILQIIFLVQSANCQYWIQCGGSVTVDEAMGVCADNANSIFTTGYFTSTLNMDGHQLISSGLEDIFISKMNTSGAISWIIRTGGSGSERALAIDVDNVGNIVVCGYFYGTTTIGTTTLTSLGQQDIFIAKYDTSGNFLWAQQAGGTNSDIANIVKFDHLGNIIVAGEFAGTCLFSGNALNSLTSSIDAFIVKYDSNGNVIWLKKGSGNFTDRATGIAIDPTNDIYITGAFSDTVTFDFTHPNTILNSVFVIKLGSTGTEKWFRWLGSGVSVSPGGICYSSNGINITGSFSGNLVFLGGSGSTTFTPTLSNNIYISRITANGLLDFLTFDGSDSDLSSTCITTKSNGDILVAGNFKCRFKDYSSHYGTGIFCSVGFWDTYVGSYSQTGSWQWARHFAGKQNDFVNGITTYSDSLTVITGSYQENYLLPVKLTQITAHGTQFLDFDYQGGNLNYCGDGEYSSYVIYQSKGNSDIYVNAGLNLSREPLDYFSRAPGPCNRNYKNMCVTGPLGICGDTVFTCATAVFNMFPGIGEGDAYNTFLSPDFNFNWSNGDTTGFIVTATPGTISATATSYDGCFLHNGIAELIASYQTQPLITDSKGINVNSASTTPVTLCVPDSVELLCTNPGNSTVTWSGFPVGMNPIKVNSSGVYACLLTNQFGCTNSSFVEVDLVNPISTVIDPHLKWLDDIDGDDHISVCAYEFFGVYLYDENSNPGGLLYQCIPDLSFANYFLDSATTNMNYDSFTDCIHLTNSFSSAVAGNYTLIITSQIIRLNPCGNDTSYVTDTLFVEVRPAIIGTLNFTVSGPANICPGGTVEIIAAPPGNTYTWQNGFVGDTLVVSQPGTYSVSGNQTIINSFGCPDVYNGSGLHTVLFYPQPVINVIPASGVICPNDSVLLACNGSSQINWFGPGGLIGTGTNTIFINTPGNYSCFQNVGPGCDLLSNTVNLFQYSSPAILADPDTFCVNDSTQLSILAAPGSTIQWLPPFTGSSSIQYATTSGTYSCNVTSCGTTSNLSISISTYPPAAIPFISFTPPDLISTPALGYQWLLNGIPLPAANSQSFTPIQIGNYTVISTDVNGCTALSDPFLFTAVENYNPEEGIVIYPIPTTNYLTIGIKNLTIQSELKVRIFNVEGKNLYTNLLPQDKTIHFDFSNGIYLLEITIDKNVVRKKFIVQE